MMQPETKEQFKLLQQYSDDSKSLSDLELTEIVVPRKRKVRRKTKPKNGHHRHRKQLTGDGSTGAACKNIGIWVAIASNVCWLLILSYIVSMVHSEYAQLDKLQFKMTDTLKTNLDEWHDKTHSLEVNQSTLFHKLFDLQQSMKNLTDDFLQLRAYVQQQAQTNDVARVGMLEKSVADFGATLKSLNSEIDSLKNRSIKFQEDNRKDIEYFKYLVVQRKLNETEVGGGSGGVATAESIQNRRDIEALRNITNSIMERLEKVNATFTSFANVEDQKVDALNKNANELNDSVANITSQDVNKAMKNYQDQIALLENRIGGLEKVAGTLEQGQKSVDQLKGQLDGLNAALQRLQTPVSSGGGEEEAGSVTSQQPQQERKGREGAPIM